MPRPSKEQPAWVAEIENIYADLESRSFTRACIARTECCQFHITGRIPHLTRGEALYLRKGIRASGRRTVPESNDGRCPMLRPDGKCMVYAHRPFGCRTHFCTAAGGDYSRGEVLDLIRRLEELDERLCGDGPRQITVILKEPMG